jgi:uncharacterized protein with FMN-binding domain
MKNTLRAALVVLVLAGMYAGVATPAPAKNQAGVTMSEGTDPTPTTLPSQPAPTRPTNPKST